MRELHELDPRASSTHRLSERRILHGAQRLFAALEPRAIERLEARTEADETTADLCRPWQADAGQDSASAEYADWRRDHIVGAAPHTARTSNTQTTAIARAAERTRAQTHTEDDRAHQFLDTIPVSSTGILGRTTCRHGRLSSTIRRSGHIAR